MNEQNKESNILTNELKELKALEESLELKLSIKKQERNSIVENDYFLEKKIDELKHERDKKINIQKTIINNFAEGLAILMAFLTIYGGIKLFSLIPSNLVLSQIAAGFGLAAGLGSVYLVAVCTIIFINKKLKNHFKKIAMKKPRYIEFTKKINLNKKEMINHRKNIQTISTEIDKIQVDIEENKKIISQKRKRLEKIKETDIISANNKVCATQHEKKTKPYTMIKKR